MLKGIKVRLYPNKEQEININKSLGCCRVVYNSCLKYKMDAYDLNKTNLGLKELGIYLYNDLRKNENYKYLAEQNTKPLTQEIIDLLKAYDYFFKKIKGFPKFKSKKDSIQNCRFPNEAISKRNIYLNNELTLTTSLKDIKFRCSDRDRKILDKYKKNIKSATLSKSITNKYFLGFLIDIPVNKELTKTDNIVGIDLGIKDFVITSNGEKFESLKQRAKNKNKLKRLNRQLSKKKLIGTDKFLFNIKYNKDVEIKKPSNNREKARIRLARFHEKLNNQKENYLHYASNKLLNENQVIVIENLNLMGMLKNHSISGALQNMSLGRFKQILKYKANWFGREIIEIGRFYPSSKLCNCCGYKNINLKLIDRNWTCPECGVTHDRDINAAINIKKEGERIMKIGSRTTKFTLVDYPPMDDRLSNEGLKSCDRLKQENKFIKHRII